MPRRRARGFTLIELLVVLAILGLLIGLVGPRFLGQLGGAKSKSFNREEWVNEMREYAEFVRGDLLKSHGTAVALRKDV